LNYAHNSENLKLMYQLQDSRLLNSKHNSSVFAHIEILNHIFAKLQIGLTHLSPVLRFPPIQEFSKECHSLNVEYVSNLNLQSIERQP
jgi:hypothetical protein